MDGIRSVLVAVDESDHSKRALTWAARHVHARNPAELHLATVLPPGTAGPISPLSSSGAVALFTLAWEQQLNEEYQAAAHTLRWAVDELTGLGVPRELVHTHGVAAVGGASGVGASIVEFAKAREVDLVVLGSRGLGAVKRSLLSLVGLGSVSDYCVHHCCVPVVVVRPPEKGAEAHEEPAVEEVEGLLAPSKRKICIAVDDSLASEFALEWLLQHVVGEADDLHVISAAAAIPFPVPLADYSTSAAVASMETQRWHEERAQAMRAAESLCAAGVLTAERHGVPRSRMWFRALQPEGGASDVAESLLHYVRDNHMDLLVLGSRGLGAFKRVAYSLAGLGSVADYCVHHCPCPVLVTKMPEHHARTHPHEPHHFRDASVHRQHYVGSPPPATAHPHRHSSVDTPRSHSAGGVPPSPTARAAVAAEAPPSATAEEAASEGYAPPSPATPRRHVQRRESRSHSSPPAATGSPPKEHPGSPPTATATTIKEDPASPLGATDTPTKEETGSPQTATQSAAKEHLPSKPATTTAMHAQGVEPSSPPTATDAAAATPSKEPNVPPLATATAGAAPQGAPAPAPGTAEADTARSTSAAEGGNGSTAQGPGSGMPGGSGKGGGKGAGSGSSGIKSTRAVPQLEVHSSHA